MLRRWLSTLSLTVRWKRLLGGIARENTLIDRQVATGEAAECNFLHIRLFIEKATHRFNRDGGGELDRVAIYSGADAWKCDRAKVMRDRYLEGLLVARCKSL